MFTFRYEAIALDSDHQESNGKWTNFLYGPVAERLYGSKQPVFSCERGLWIKLPVRPARKSWWFSSIGVTHSPATGSACFLSYLIPCASPHPIPSYPTPYHATRGLPWRVNSQGIQDYISHSLTNTLRDDYVESGRFNKEIYQYISL